MATTSIAAESLGIKDRGKIKNGLLADLIITNCRSVAEIFYDWTKCPTRVVIKRGRVIPNQLDLVL
jgi:imidazolonepropionase-like amidohydrolase